MGRAVGPRDFRCDGPGYHLLRQHFFSLRQDGTAMTTIRLSIALAAFLIASPSTTPAVAQTRDDEDQASKALDQNFEKLLAAAQKDPKKAHWKALRHTFAQTSHYQPYDTSWRDDIVKVAESTRDGNLKLAESAL